MGSHTFRTAVSNEFKQTQEGKAYGEKGVPMIHLLNARATVDWYENIGFTVIESYGGLRQ